MCSRDLKSQPSYGQVLNCSSSVSLEMVEPLQRQKTVYPRRFLNTPIQEKTGSRMETRPKGPSIFASPGGKYKLDKQSLSKEFQDGATKY